MKLLILTYKNHNLKLKLGFSSCIVRILHQQVCVYSSLLTGYNILNFLYQAKQIY